MDSRNKEYWIEQTEERSNGARTAPPSTSLDDSLNHLFTRYALTRRAVKVNIRKLVPGLNRSERYTHLLHPYPAKLLPHIPYLFIRSNLFSKEGDLVLDPFGGSGTVGLEAILANRRAVLFDCNPLASLIAEVKTRRLPTPRISRSLRRLLKRAPTHPPRIPDVVNIDKWFARKRKVDLGRLLAAILRIRNEEERRFFLLCLSVTARRLSRADPRLSVPVLLKKARDLKGAKARSALAHLRRLRSCNTYSLFSEVTEQNINRLSTLNSAALADASIHLADFTCPAPPNDRSYLRPGSIQLIVTSPPYGSAQKYIRASSLGLGWSDLAKASDLRELERRSIGAEHFRKEEYLSLRPTGITAADKLLAEVRRIDPLRAHISFTYLSRLLAACARMASLLKQGGYLVMVLGDNSVCGLRFRTIYYLKQFLNKSGFSLQLELRDDIPSRGLMTKRNVTAGLILSETILVFRKS